MPSLFNSAANVTVVLIIMAVCVCGGGGGGGELRNKTLQR